MNTELQNYKALQEALKLKDNIEGAYLKLGELLYKIRDERQYQPTHDTFPEFLMEMDMTEGTASKMITVYKKFILEFKIPEQEIIDAKGWSKVYAIVKVANTPDEALKWLRRASVASRGHLVQDIEEQITGIDKSKCEHSLRTLKICRKCNYKFEEYV